MLDSLRKFVRKLGAAEGERHFDADDARLALAALLVHCMQIDGAVSEAEQEKLRRVLENTFGVKRDDLRRLLDDAFVAEREAVDIYRFTSVLKRQMSEEQRVRVVEDLWQIVFADGKSHEFEENLVWRVAELLGVSRQERIATKRAVTENKSAAQ